MKLGTDDRADVADLVHRYAARVDDRQFGSVAELFTDDATLLLPDPPAVLAPVRAHSGYAAISEAIAAVASTVRTQHAIVGEVYDPGAHPGTARGRITCVAHHWVRDDDQFRDVTWHLRYADEYRHTGAAGWRICRRELTIDAIDIRPVRRVRPAQP